MLIELLCCENEDVVQVDVYMYILGRDRPKGSWEGTPKPPLAIKYIVYIYMVFQSDFMHVYF